MKSLLITISTSLVLISPIVYIHSIVRGQTRPHRTTRFVVMFIAVLSTLSLGVGAKNAAFWLALASAIQAVMIFTVSLKKGMGGWARLDITCLVIALAGIILWQTTGQAIVGLYASLVADFVGYVPAMVKTYRLPHTEHWPFFAIDTVAGALSLAATTHWSLYSLSYPIYIILINGGISLTILSRSKSLKKPAAI